MNPHEQLLARLMFQCRLCRGHGDAFQQLFWDVMKAKHGQGMTAVRPQGALGDGGNDGFLPSDGHYFQVYGPVDPEDKVTTAATKLEDDFEKLKANWNIHAPIKAYSFVFNDKYQGAFKTISQALASLETKNPGVQCRPFLASDLEDEFMSLDMNGVQKVLGALLPDPARIERLDYGVLKEVIAHIVSAPASDAETRFGSLPNIEEKVQLNNLCSTWGEVISAGARQTGHVDNYFRSNSKFSKQTLRNHMVGTYEQARQAAASTLELPEGRSKQDLIFDDFRTRLTPAGATVSMVNATDVLIAYYFEACDVFDPHAPTRTS